MMNLQLKILICILAFVPEILSYKHNRGLSNSDYLSNEGRGGPQVPPETSSSNKGRGGPQVSPETSSSNGFRGKSQVPPETSSSNGASQGNVAINFETEENVILKRNYRIKDRPACDIEKDLGFCENDTEYNSTIINLFNDIMKTSKLSNLITDVLNETVIPINKSALGPHLRNRIGFSSEQTLCPSTETLIYPKRGQTPNKDWVFILNQGNVQQAVKVEKCLQHDSQCILGGGPLEQTTCRQKYIYKKLLAMDTAGNNIVTESIYMPSCCVCYVSNDFVSTRNAGGTSRIQAKPSSTTN